MSLASLVLDELSAVSRARNLREAYGPFLGVGRPDLLSDDQRFLLALGDSLAEPANLDASALVWVSPEMVDLLRHAALSLPPYPFTPTVLPWPKAVVLASKPLVDLSLGRPAIGYSITGIQWSDMYVDVAPAPVYVVCPLARLKKFNAIVPAVVSTLTPGKSFEELSGPDRQGIDQFSKICCTLWLLLKQRVAIKRRALPARGAARRWLRSEQRPVPEITIIELRRPLNTEQRSDEPGFVEWSRRWIVDGHWRNQYHPSTGERVPTWIAPYVKGPDDKPLVVQRKVHAWTR